MGRPKEFKARLKYQIETLSKKTLTNQLKVELNKNLGLSPIEAELLALDLKEHLNLETEMFLPGQLLISGTMTAASYRRGGRGDKAEKTIKITPLSQEDLELKLAAGVKALKINRILRVIEEAQAQDSLLSMRQLVLLFNITPTALRKILKELRDKEISAPTVGLRKDLRERKFYCRSTLLLKDYLASRGNLKENASKYYLPVKRAENILKEAAYLAKHPENTNSLTAEKKEWLEFLTRCEEEELKFLLAYHLEETDKALDLRAKLKQDYSFSPVKIRAIMLFLNELKFKLAVAAEGKTIYQAVSATTRAGEPLEQAELIPVEIDFLLPEDGMTEEDNRELNRLKEIKQRKIFRYCQNAKEQGAYLSYADLSFLLGINTESLRQFVKEMDIKPPLRGYACDIGRGTSHKEEIIRLYLEMYTETEIAQRTGHSYEAIEEYIREFAAVYLLKQRGLSPALIRKTTGRSRKLIEAYLKLIREYDRAEYAFRFHQLEKIAALSGREGEKRGP